MGRSLKSVVSASEIAKALGLVMQGDDVVVTRVDAAGEAHEASICFASNESWVSRSSKAGLVLCSPTHAHSSNATKLLCDNPRLEFGRVVTLLADWIGFVWDQSAPVLHPTVRVGRNTVIGHGVRIGQGSVIGHNVVLGDEVSIGERCVIKSGSVIGEEGFGFERQDSGPAVRIPHIGGVRIGNDVEIGSLCTVCRGTLGNTQLADGVKIDDHVHIAHNVFVDRNVFITACVELSGGVQVGENVWLSPGVTVIDQIHIGADAMVGIGSVVAREVAAGTRVFGNPAKVLPSQERTNAH